MGLTSKQFARHKAELDRLRRSNAVLDEICRDHEYLADLLNRGVEGEHLRDIQSSLAGLEEEIGKYLNEDKT